MGLIFKNDLHDEFGGRALGYIPYGAADFGEIAAVAEVVGDGGDDAFYTAWTAAGDRFEAQADTALASGRKESAAELYLRAACFYGLSYPPLYGEPVDPRLKSAFLRQIGAFEKGLALFDAPIAPHSIPFEGHALKAYFIHAAGCAGARRPLIIFTNGYDASVTDLYFASAVAASRRGYHSLIFDGPGQGETLILHDVRLRPDWEAVIRPVVDFALTLPAVDPDRIALSGWSLGGYLALRAASGEPRLKACVADPGLEGMAAGLLRVFAAWVGVAPGSDLAAIDDAMLDKMLAVIKSDPKLSWRVIQRGFWVNGVSTLKDFIGSTMRYDLGERIREIRCPTLVTMAEDDPLSFGAPQIYDALACPKTLLKFNGAEGAGEHCEMRNRSLLNRRTLDWLDSIFA